MANLLKGLLYKKTLDSNGNVTGKVPFLPKTLAKLIIRDNGDTVEDALAKLEANKSYLVYETVEEYQTALAAGEIPEGTLSIVKGA